MTLKNYTSKKSKHNIQLQLLDPRKNMNILVDKEIKTNITANGSTEVSIEGKLNQPALWSAETPNLYTLLINLKDSKGNI
ncbi:hypothetical protein, partial [Streptomyces scabiei]|uniref:hypothetical protein n=1 Tax=Streptomyces scabiei TaxID=1930 RepID=UPI0038F75FD3